MRLRVLQVLTRLNIGGPARQALNIDLHLREWGHQSVIAGGSPATREGDLAEWDEIDIVHLSRLRRDASPALIARSVVDVARLIRAFRPHVVHSHMAMAGFVTRAAARLLPKRPALVHTFHGHVLEGYFSPSRERLYTQIERGLAMATDTLIAVSPTVERDLLGRGIGRAGQWHVIPYGLDLGPLLELAPSGGATRRVGIIGRLVPIKDHDTFLQAMAALPADVEVVVAGDGELRETLERRAAELRLGSRVRFLGWVRDLKTLYGSLDVVVCASRNEGTPLVLIEAMAAARPVVATEVGGVGDVVADGSNGFLVPPADPEAIAKAVKTVLESGIRARTMGLEGRRSVARYYSVDRVAAATEALYLELASRRLPAPAEA